MSQQDDAALGAAIREAMVRDALPQDMQLAIARPMVRVAGFFLERWDGEKQRWVVVDESKPGEPLAAAVRRLLEVAKS